MCRPAVFPERIYLSAVSLLGGFIVARFPILTDVCPKTVNFGRVFRSCQNPFFAAEAVRAFLKKPALLVHFLPILWLSAGIERDFCRLHAITRISTPTARVLIALHRRAKTIRTSATRTIGKPRKPFPIFRENFSRQNRNRGYVIPKNGFCLSL